MIDYTKGENLASDIICDGLRVSTASFPREEYYGSGKDAMIETWVFGDKEKGFESKQYIHERIRTREKAIIFHNKLVMRLRRYNL